MTDVDSLEPSNLREAVIRMAVVLEGVVKNTGEMRTEMKNLNLGARIPVLESDVKTLKNIVYGACGFILLAVLGALVYLVVHRGGA